MAETEISIVTLDPHDWPQWRGLRLEALQSDPAAFSSTYEESLAQPDEYWWQRFADEQRLHMMARKDDRAVGMVGGYLGSDEGDQSVAVVFGMYVSAPYRSQGIGNLLLRAVIDRMSARPGIATIRLWVGEAQYPARKMYESAGFRTVDIQQNPGGDELIMELQVG